VLSACLSFSVRLSLFVFLFSSSLSFFRVFRVFRGDSSSLSCWNSMLIEQAIYGSRDEEGYRFLARSPGFAADWLAGAERLCTGFGERPGGVTCPACLFALPFGPRRVAIVQVADQGQDDTGRPGILGFRLLILPRSLYVDLGGDPFWIADQLPPPSWEIPASEELPTLEWSVTPPRRLVADLEPILKSPHSATYLGATQALVDGGKVVIERQGPDPLFMRSLWALLPTATRCELWPASFAFDNTHGFDALAVPRAEGPEYATYLLEARAGEYPEGRYEHALQRAVEAGDQGEVDALLARRSHTQMLRLAVVLLLGFILIPIIFQLIPGPAPILLPPPAKKVEVLHLPPVHECPRLTEGTRDKLATRLQALGKRLGLTLPAGSSEGDLKQSIAQLDDKLGTPHPGRNPGPLNELGPIQRQLRALLWKHEVAEYQERRLNPIELVEKLEQQLQDKKIVQDANP
jgi:hypothetical protein